jgi:hypothetical protein
MEWLALGQRLHGVYAVGVTHVQSHRTAVGYRRLPLFAAHTNLKLQIHLGP